MVVREGGIIKEPVKPEQPLKALVPIVVTEGGMVKEPVSPEQPTKALEAILVMVGSRVICPEQQEEEGVFLLMQLRVIPWTEEKRRRRHTQREIFSLEVVRVPIMTGKSSESAAGRGVRRGITGFTRI
jgi:hypothetical protein